MERWAWRLAPPKATLRAIGEELDARLQRMRAHMIEYTRDSGSSEPSSTVMIMTVDDGSEVSRVRDVRHSLYTYPFATKPCLQFGRL